MGHIINNNNTMIIMPMPALLLMVPVDILNGRTERNPFTGNAI